MSAKLKYLPDNLLSNKSFQVALAVTAIFLTGFYAYSAFLLLSLDYLPLTSDEAGYLKAIETWLINGKPVAPYVLDESFSKKEFLSSHGYLYTYLYGIVMKVTGYQPEVFVLLNIGFTLAGAFFVFLLKELSLVQKLLFACFYFSFFVVVSYSFTYMVESFHYFLIIPAAYLLVRVYERGSTGDLLLFVFLVAAMAMFRLSWVFLILALLPLKRSLKHWLVMAGIFLVILLVAMKHNSLYLAPYMSGFKFKMALLYREEGFSAVALATFGHAVENIVSYFTKYVNSYYFITKYLFVLMTVASVWFGFRNRIFIGVAFVSLGLFFALVTTYDVFAYREIRTLGFLVVFQFFVLLWYAKLELLLIIILLQLASYKDLVEDKVFGRVDKSLEQNAYIESFKDLEVLRQGLFDLETEKDLLLVTLDKKLGNEFPFRLLLPFQNYQGKPIVYNFYANKDSHFMSEYYLSRYPVSGKFFRKTFQQQWQEEGFVIFELHEKASVDLPAKKRKMERLRKLKEKKLERQKLRKLREEKLKETGQ